MWPSAHLFVKVGETFTGGRDVVVAVAEPANVDCLGRWNWEEDLASADRDDRYAAVKAGRHLGVAGSEQVLVRLATDPEEDWRVALEAAAVLAKADPATWVPGISRSASNTQLPLDQQMEAVFVLTELNVPAAADALDAVARASEDRNDEVRAAAVWGLGTGECADPTRVVPYLEDPSDRVALHAAASLPDTLDHTTLARLTDWLRKGRARQSAIAGAILARKREVASLHSVAADPSAPGHVAATHSLGSIPSSEVKAALGSALDANLESRLEPLWIRHDDWTLTPENAGALEALGAQRLRFLGPSDLNSVRDVIT